MYGLEQENVATREDLTQLQEPMGTILEHLQAQRDRVVVVNQADATMVTFVADTTIIVMDPINHVAQPAAASQPLSQAGPGRFAATYPWGMPHNYNPRFSTGNLFMPYQSFVVASSNVNYDAFPLGIPNHYSAQGVETEGIHPPIANVYGAEDQEPEYRGLHLNFHIPAQPIQSNSYASIVMVPPFPKNVAL